MTFKCCLNPGCEGEELVLKGYFTLSLDGPVGFISVRAYGCPKCGRIQLYEREDPK